MKNPSKTIWDPAPHATTTTTNKEKAKHLEAFPRTASLYIQDEEWFDQFSNKTGFSWRHQLKKIRFSKKQRTVKKWPHHRPPFFTNRSRHNQISTRSRGWQCVAVIKQTNKMKVVFCPIFTKPLSFTPPPHPRHLLSKLSRSYETRCFSPTSGSISAP